MTDPITRRPQPGELVHVGDLPGTFRVLERDGGVYTLTSEHGAVCRAGVLAVRLAEHREGKAA